MQQLPASTDEDGWDRTLDDVGDVDVEQDDDAVRLSKWGGDVGRSDGAWFLSNCFTPHVATCRWWCWCQKIICALSAEETHQSKSCVFITNVVWDSGSDHFTPFSKKKHPRCLLSLSSVYSPCFCSNLCFRMCPSVEDLLKNTESLIVTRFWIFSLHHFARSPHLSLSLCGSVVTGEDWLVFQRGVINIGVHERRLERQEVISIIRPSGGSRGVTLEMNLLVKVQRSLLASFRE